MTSSNLLAGAIALFALITIGSCSKESGSTVSGETSITIELLGSEMESEEVNNSRAATNISGELEKEQTKIIDLENNFQLVATLTPRTNAATTEFNGKASEAASTHSRAATKVRTPLGTGVKYRVLAYLGDRYVGKMDYEVGKAPSGFDKLAIGSTYTFIAYSVNSADELPEVTNVSRLSTATLTSSEDLMYFQSTIKIASGDNYLGVILKHQFSQITMTTRLTDDTRGDIVSLTNVRFTGRGTKLATPRKNGTVKLSNGALSYSNDTTSVAINYPNLGGGLRSVTASPTLLISPKITTTDVVIGNILINATINGKQVSTVRNNLVLEDFLISPYQKYDLVLHIKNPCTEPTGDDTFEWRSQHGTVKTNTLYASGANYGYTFDIYELDNSFNMEINGQQLATKEIQFEYTNSSDLPKRNVKFADGSIWGQDNVSQIWNIIGNKDYPSVKLVISSKGEVSLFGRKNNTDRALYPIVFTDDTKFNKINWKTADQNKVVIKQSVINITVMHGRGYGVKVIPCP